MLRSMVSIDLRPVREDKKLIANGTQSIFFVLCALIPPLSPAVALALNEQILPEGEEIPALTIEDGHASGHRDIKPDLIIWPDGQLVLDKLQI